MKKLILSLLTLSFLATACTNPDNQIEPAIQSKVPGDVSGKWMWGTFSMSNFWKEGQYAGNPYEQSVVFDFKPNGEYEQYVINATTSYNCRTEAYTYIKGKVKFDEDEQTFTLTPKSGNYRGNYSCAPSKNFKRDAKQSELKGGTFYYEVVVQNGQKKLLIKDTPSDTQAMTLKATSW
ncbi:hypothetical protein GCM10023189_18240 [Nibrella saemangeumensis]|uniref:Lipocalin-like domain-containing protein n=1 Tax=Nibrella saemangeumensis TaxID=1084526 RepID=A0ABP8MRB6_9BACT